MKTTKTFLKLICAFLLLSFIAVGQPTHLPITGYKYPSNVPDGYSKSTLTGTYGHSIVNIQDIAVTQNYHFQCGTSSFSINGSNSTRMYLCKKNAITGAPISMSNVNIGTLQGASQTVDICNGMLLDEANNRIYLFGTSQSPGSYKSAVVICYNMTTLEVETNFAYGSGVTYLSSLNQETNVTDMAIVGNLGNSLSVIAAVVHEKNVFGKNYININMFDKYGAYYCEKKIDYGNYKCYGNRIKKVKEASINIVGKVVNDYEQAIPMVWQLTPTPTCLDLNAQTPLNFSTPPLGYGEFVDFDMEYNNQWGNIIAIGNNTNNSGLWGKYAQSGNSFILSSTFKGTQAGDKFIRCLAQPDGYTVILSGGGTNLGKLGFLTIAGNMYANTQQLLAKETTGLNKDKSGNIIIGGCLNNQHTTIKFSSYNGVWGGEVNKTEAPMAVSKQKEEILIDIFPNPASNNLTLTFNGTSKNYTNLQVVDISGKKIIELNDFNIEDKEKINLDITDLKKGVYFIRLTSNEKSIFKKVIKE